MNSECLYSADKLTAEDFRRLCRLIKDRSGIEINEGKRILLEGRIRKRMLVLGITDYWEYCHFLFSPAGLAHELTLFIDAVTTNKTDFFREPAHFEFLRQESIPNLQRLYGAGTTRPLRVWSAACSTGEEPYTLAMVISESAQAYPAYRFSILATDISTKVLAVGQEAIYQEERANPIPARLREKYLLRSKDRTDPRIRIVPALRDKVVFSRLNLLDPSYPLEEAMDVVFCRNVLIYFNRTTQADIIQKLCRYLRPGGYLFMGHSEVLTNLQIPVVSVAASIYQKIPE